MNEPTNSWQQGAKDTFIWLDRFYKQCQSLMDDAEKFFHDVGWKVKDRDGLGGVANSSDLKEWPFVYLKAIGAYPPGVGDETDQGTAALLGILIHDEQRKGPVCFGGAVRWSHRSAFANHWMIEDAMTNRKGRFRITGEQPWTALANDESRRNHQHIEEFTWIEAPLDQVSSPERLHELVKATMKLVKGDKTEAGKIAKAWSK